MYRNGQKQNAYGILNYKFESIKIYLLSDTISRTSREWRVRICITFIGITIQKPFWSEYFWTIPMCRVTMKIIHRKYIKGSLRKKIFSIFNLNIFIMGELSGKNWN